MYVVWLLTCSNFSVYVIHCSGCYLQRADYGWWLRCVHNFDKLTVGWDARVMSWLVAMWWLCCWVHQQSYCTLCLVSIGMVDYLRAGKPSWCVTSHPDQLSLLTLLEWEINVGSWARLTSHQTHYRSYEGWVFTGQITQPTVWKQWRKRGPKD